MKLTTEELNKSFEVKSICRIDLDRYFSKKEIEKMTDEDMKYIADKMGDYMQECYWDALEEVAKRMKNK